MNKFRGKFESVDMRPKNNQFPKFQDNNNFPYKPKTVFLNNSLMPPSGRISKKSHKFI